MTRLQILGLLMIVFINGHAQSTDTCHLRVRIANKSTYQIDKLLINKRIHIDTLDSRATSSFFCTDRLFNSLNYDITFTRKRFLRKYEWAHVISYPIDYIGEKEITEGDYQLILTISKIGKGKYDIKFEREKITTGYNN